MDFWRTLQSKCVLCGVAADTMWVGSYRKDGKEFIIEAPLCMVCCCSYPSQEATIEAIQTKRKEIANANPN